MLITYQGSIEVCNKSTLIHIICGTKLLCNETLVINNGRGHHYWFQ